MAATAKRNLSWLAVLVGAALLASPQASARPSLPALEKELFCVTCKIPLAEARSPQAESERAFIRRLLAEGKDEAAIKRALVAEYGPAVLALPSTSGVNLLVYLVPPAALVVAVAVLAFALRRWRRKGARSEASEPPLPLDPVQRLRLARELERFRD